VDHLASMRFAEFLSPISEGAPIINGLHATKTSYNLPGRVESVIDINSCQLGNLCFNLKSHISSF